MKYIILSLLIILTGCGVGLPSIEVDDDFVLYCPKHGTELTNISIYLDIGAVGYCDECKTRWAIGFPLDIKPKQEVYGTEIPTLSDSDFPVGVVADEKE
jgi:hypothetical protein